MLINYLKVAFRNIWKHKSFSLINIFGLSLSMSVCIIIIMLVADQKNIDRYNSKRDNIYRVTTRKLDSDGLFNTYATTPLPLANKLIEDYPGIKQAIRIRSGFGNNWIGIGQNVNIPVSGFFVDPGFINLFEYELESGNSQEVLTKPNSVVLKKKTAIKLYGDNDPIGKIINIEPLGDYIVTGVLKEQEGKSHIKFDALASISSLVRLEKDSLISPTLANWKNHFSGYVYIELEKGTSPETVVAQMAEINQSIFGEMVDRNHKFELQHLLKITPGPMLGNEIGPTLPAIFVYFLAGIALIIMISASFNYMNLSIARALTRAKEVGIRKVSGATRGQLVFQFLTEAILLSLFALVISHIILVFLKPAFDALNFSRFLHWELSENLIVHIFIIAFAILVGVMSGLFPAFILSSFRPIQVLKDLTGIKLFSKMGIRKVLIVAQFSLSLIFIVTVSLVFNQLKMMVTADFGFRTENIVNVRLNDADFEQFKTSISQNSAIVNVSGTTHVPGAGNIHTSELWKDPTDVASITTGIFSVDENYVDLMGLELIAGTNFQHLSTTANEIIINEMAVSSFGFEAPQNAIGKVIYDDDTTSQLHVVGVIKDYHYLMLIMDIGPMYLRYVPEDFRMVHVQLNEKNLLAGMSAIESSYEEVSDGEKVDAKFFKSEIEEYYELLFGDLVNIVGLSSFLALSIACLGLLGIATYTIETRIKEVSIRKILGATDKQLIYQLSKNFFFLLLIAIVISVPLAWFFNNLWLQQIAYRTSISIGVVASAVGILLVVGITTIGSQTWRASAVNPIDNLRSE